MIDEIQLEFNVALRKESVDRNDGLVALCKAPLKSLSARRAWIEIPMTQTITT